MYHMLLETFLYTITFITVTAGVIPIISTTPIHLLVWFVFDYIYSLLPYPPHHCKALNSLVCADVPLRSTYSLT